MANLSIGRLTQLYNVILYLSPCSGIDDGVNREVLLPARERLDRLAIGLSGLCVAHCVLSSLLLAFVASAGGVFLHPLIHEVGLVLAIALGALGLGQGVRAHGALLPLGIGVIGLGLMAFALTQPHNGSEALFTIIGALILALGHILNRRALSA